MVMSRPRLMMTREIEIHFYPNEENISFEVKSTNPRHSSELITYMLGKLDKNISNVFGKTDLQGIQKRCNEQLTHHGIYDKLNEYGLEYGQLLGHSVILQKSK